MQYYEVAPTIIVRADQSTLTYSSAQEVAVGSIVEIPVGKKNVTGVVIERVAKPAYDVKELVAKEIGVLPQPLIETLLWTASYYRTPLATVLQTALPSGIHKNRRSSTITTSSIHRERTKKVFTADQHRAIETINDMTPGTALLHGVTGSGKTLIYIESAKRALAEGRSAIILVPEIALTSQLVAEFEHHFDEILLTHSRQTEAQRHKVWSEALVSDKPRIVIGPRSALFMPLASVGLIVIDECHEPSYKQEQSPRYSALRLASTLSRFHKSKLVLGSATPNVSDYYVAAASERPIIRLESKARSDSVKPTVQVIDMTKKANFSAHRFFSDALIARFEKTLAAGQQALVFHNRRGSAASTLCENCGWQAGCPRCFIPLTLHSDQHKLICHICAASSRVPTQCPSCGGVDIIHKGMGTKLIESELRKLFPKATIARFDADTDATQTVERRYQELYDGSIDIIIGTQVIAKGLDLPQLRTVGVVQADAGLSLPDYTAAERTFQLLYQVIGRVGRSSHETHVVVQSYQPTNPAVQDGISQDYAAFYERALALRKAGNFPPFTYLLKLTCTYKTEATAIKNAKALAGELARSGLPIELLGPTPSFYERVRDTYRWQIVVKSSSRQALIDALQYMPTRQWQYELDPLSLL